MVENKKKKIRTQTILNLIMILFSILCIYPILLMVSISITDSDAIYEYGYSIIERISQTAKFDICHITKTKDSTVR